MCSHLLLWELQNLQFSGELPWKSPTKMVGGMKSCLESNPIPTNDTWTAQTKPRVQTGPKDTETDPELPCVQTGPKDTETDPELPLSVWVSPAEAHVSCCLPWGQGLCLQQTCDLKHVAYALLVKVTISPTIELLSRWPTNCRTIRPKKLSHC